MLRNSLSNYIIDILKLIFVTLIENSLNFIAVQAVCFIDSIKVQCLKYFSRYRVQYKCFSKIIYQYHLFHNSIIFMYSSIAFVNNLTNKPFNYQFPTYQKKNLRIKSVNMWIFILSLPAILKQYLFNRFSKKIPAQVFNFYSFVFLIDLGISFELKICYLNKLSFRLRSKLIFKHP